MYRRFVDLNDHYMFSATMEEHAEKLRDIFEKLEQAKYLGHLYTPGCLADPGKVRAIEKHLC